MNMLLHCSWLLKTHKADFQYCNIALLLVVANRLSVQNASMQKNTHGEIQ